MANNYALNMLAQSQREPNRPDQVRNNAGGYVFELDIWKRLERFLILGSDAPTYYQQARALTRENAAIVNECWAADPFKTHWTVVNVSNEGRAPKNDAAIFALALGSVHSDVKARQYALAGVGTVCRTATHLFMFVNMARTLGKGWGRAMKRAVANWYELKAANDLAYQVIKYRQREGYTHNRLIDTAHPSGKTGNGAVYRWIVGKPAVEQALPPIISKFELAQKGAFYPDLPWEAYPTERLSDPELWRGMLPTMPINAMVRNLGKMTSIGVLKPLSPEVNIVLEKLRNVKGSRMHPLQFLTAMKVYAQGHGDKGSLRWEPVQTIIRALNDAFYLAFANVTPTGKNFLLALDVSSSMRNQTIAGSSFNSREGAAAMALVTATMEQNCHIVGFSVPPGVRPNNNPRSGTNLIVPLNVSAGQRLDDVIKIMEDVPFGATDCALPMLYAIEQKLDVDTFVIYTDNETHHGAVHPYVALQNYRKVMNKPEAKLVVVGMTSTGFTIADPRDAGMLDVVGFDSNVPALISGF